MKPDDCENCGALREELRVARAERDEALRAIAVEREKVNAVILIQSAVKPAPPPPPRPLRHWIVDVLNDGMKKALPLPQAGLRAAARILRGRDKT